MMGKEKHKDILVSAKSNLQKLGELHFFLSQIKSHHIGIFKGILSFSSNEKILQQYAPVKMLVVTLYPF